MKRPGYTKTGMEEAMIRKLTASLIVLAALSGAAPRGATPAPLPTGVPIITYDVPQDKGAQEVQVLKREFPVGSPSGWHVHPGVETAYLLDGVMSFEMAGQPKAIMRAGDSFTVPRGVAHNGVNVGRFPARMVIVYVVDKGAPVRTAVPPPAQ